MKQYWGVWFIRPGKRKINDESHAGPTSPAFFCVGLTSVKKHCLAITPQNSCRLPVTGRTNLAKAFGLFSVSSCLRGEGSPLGFSYKMKTVNSTKDCCRRNVRGPVFGLKSLSLESVVWLSLSILACRQPSLAQSQSQQPPSVQAPGTAQAPGTGEP